MAARRHFVNAFRYDLPCSTALQSS
jgi:hypothetical protein